MALEMPSLAGWLRSVRTFRGLTREAAALRAHVSVSYIRRIENEQLIPGRQILDHLISAYELDDPQARFTRELCEPPYELPPLEVLRKLIATPDRLANLEQLDRIGIQSMYIDPLQNVLAYNNSYADAVPGVIEEGSANLLLWAFPPTGGTPAMDERYPEPHLSLETVMRVALARAAFGRHRDAPRAIQLFELLCRNDRFVAVWEGGIDVAYTREPGNLLQRFDPDTGKPYTASVEVTEMPGLYGVRLFTSVPRRSP